MCILNRTSANELFAPIVLGRRFGLKPIAAAAGDDDDGGCGGGGGGCCCGDCLRGEV